MKLKKISSIFIAILMMGFFVDVCGYVSAVCKSKNLSTHYLCCQHADWPNPLWLRNNTIPLTDQCSAVYAGSTKSSDCQGNGPLFGTNQMPITKDCSDKGGTLTYRSS